MRLLLFLPFALLVVCSCDKARVYEDSLDFKERSWRIADTAKFNFEIKDPGRRYNVFCNLRNSLDYPYARFFVRFTLRDSAGAELGEKLVSQFLFDQKTGQPFGHSGLGDVFDHQFLLAGQQEFKHPGSYQVELLQFMRQDTLAGILSVGVRVETAEQSTR